MQYIAFIPSRYHSTRLPQKSLHMFCGKPMFWHVYTRALAAQIFDAIYIATDDERIATIAHEYSIPVVMTSTHHTSGTERIFEAVQQLNVEHDAVIVNIQGDEPLVHPSMLQTLITPFIDSAVQVTTLVTDITDADLHNPARVKVVLDIHDNALYFSRSLIPYKREDIPYAYRTHIGIYAFRYPALQTFIQKGRCTLEAIESLEQLRFLYHGISIRTVFTPYATHSVDTYDDIPIVEKLLEKERTIYKY